MLNKLTLKSQWIIPLAFFICFFNTNILVAQRNLVPNNSFENIDSCNFSVRDISVAKPWTGPYENYTEIFNECAPQKTGGTIPYDTFCKCYFQYPRTGKGFAGIYTIQNYGSNYRDYLQVKLSDSMMNGKCYLAYFYANTFDDSFFSVSNNLAASFSDTALPVLPFGSNLIFPSVAHLTPHIQLPGNPIISDTFHWIPIAGIYFAHGGEKYIVIGNFKDDTLTDTIKRVRTFVQIDAAYFIDDVFVLEANAYAGKDTAISKGDSVFIGIEQVPGVQNSWYVNGNLIKQNTGGMWVQPQQTTTYILQSTICNTTYYDTVVVSVKNVGIGQLANNKEQIKVYPNPANTNLTISQLANLKMIEVYDVVGRKLEDLKMSRLGNEIQIQVSDLAAGIYFIKATDEKGNVKNAKFVKE